MILTQRQTLLLLLALGVLLSASGFVLEHGFGVIPCKMCWWQRYAHWGIAGLAALGLTTPRAARPALMGIIAVAATGLFIAGWQFAAQHGWLPFPPTCASNPNAVLASGDDLLAAINQTKIVPCDLETFKLLGLSLAGWNIPASLTIIALSVNGLRRNA
ncbi:MAG: disulfide bond formation protein B [Hyphomicrobiales bacterium]|nr:MAG: disulfide bond formation protein B [Hyphomicrobiales bacterium]